MKNSLQDLQDKVRRPASETFRFITPHFFQNYVKWCPEDVEIENLSEEPVQQNSRGRQVTRDHSIDTESSFEVSEFISNEKFVMSGISEPSTTTYHITPLVDDKCRLSFSFEINEIDILMRPLHVLVQSFGSTLNLYSDGRPESLKAFTVMIAAS